MILNHSRRLTGKIKRCICSCNSESLINCFTSKERKTRLYPRASHSGQMHIMFSKNREKNSKWVKNMNHFIKRKNRSFFGFFGRVIIQLMNYREGNTNGKN